MCAHVQTHTPSARMNIYIYIPKKTPKFIITENNAVNITRIISALATGQQDGAFVDFHNHEVRGNVIKMHCPTTGLRP